MLRLRILESYMNGKKKSQLPYFIHEKTEAYSIHFNSNLFSKHHLCPWVTDFSSITCFHAVLLTTTQNTSLLTLPCVWLWSFLHVSLKRTVWSLLGISLCDTKARSIFLGVHYPETSGARKKSLWYVFLQIFSFWIIFSSKREASVNISDKAYC